MSSEVAEDYDSLLLSELTFSKSSIKALTKMANEKSEHAVAIVGAVESHLLKVPLELKLPVFYLIDSIMKNVTNPYKELFAKNIVCLFGTVFKKVDKLTRSLMFNLRKAWNEVLPHDKLYELDIHVHSIDPAWPVTAPVPVTNTSMNSKALTVTTNKGSIKTSTNSSPATVASATVSPTPSTSTELKPTFASATVSPTPSTSTDLKPNITIKPAFRKLKTLEQVRATKEVKARNLKRTREQLEKILEKRLKRKEAELKEDIRDLTQLEKSLTLTPET